MLWLLAALTFLSFFAMGATQAVAPSSSLFSFDRAPTDRGPALPIVGASLAASSLITLAIINLFVKIRHVHLATRLGTPLVTLLGLNKPFDIDDLPPGVARSARPGGGGGALYVFALGQVLGPVVDRLARSGGRRRAMHSGRRPALVDRPRLSSPTGLDSRPLYGLAPSTSSFYLVLLVLAISALPSVVAANPSASTSSSGSTFGARSGVGLAAAAGVVAASAVLGRRRAVDIDLSSSPPPPVRKRLRRSNGDPVKAVSELEDGAGPAEDDWWADRAAKSRARTDLNPFNALGGYVKEDDDDDDERLPDPRLLGRARALEDVKTSGASGATRETESTAAAKTSSRSSSTKGTAKGKVADRDENVPRSPPKPSRLKSSETTTHGPLGTVSASARFSSSAPVASSSTPVASSSASGSRPVPSRGLSGVSTAPLGRVAPVTTRAGTAQYASPIAAPSRTATRAAPRVESAPQSAATATLRAEIVQLLDQGAPVVRADPLGDVSVVDYMWRITSTPTTCDLDVELAKFQAFVSTSRAASDLRQQAARARSFSWVRTGSAQQPVATWAEEQWAGAASAAGLARRLAAGSVEALVAVGVTSLGVNLDSLVKMYERMSPGASILFIRHDSNEASRSLLVTPGTVLPFLRPFAEAVSLDSRLSIHTPVTFEAIASLAGACGEYGAIAEELVDFAGHGPLEDVAEYMRALVLSLGRRLVQQASAHLDTVDRYRQLDTGDEDTADEDLKTVSQQQHAAFGRVGGSSVAFGVPSGVFGRQGVLLPFCDSCRTVRENIEYSTIKGSTTRLCLPCRKADVAGAVRGSWDDELRARRKIRAQCLCVNPLCDHPEGHGPGSLLVHRSDGGVRCRPCYDYKSNHLDRPGLERNPAPSCADCNTPINAGTGHAYNEVDRGAICRWCALFEQKVGRPYDISSDNCACEFTEGPCSARRFDQGIVWKLLAPDVGPGLAYKRRTRHLQLCFMHYNDLFDRLGPPPSTCADCGRVMSEGEKHGSKNKGGLRQCRGCYTFEDIYGRQYDPTADDVKCCVNGCDTRRSDDPGNSKSFVIRTCKDGFVFQVCKRHESNIPNKNSSALTCYLERLYRPKGGR
ncbi:hypothetical protein JCM3775_001127 [Rhodotorula graminis]